MSKIFIKILIHLIFMAIGVVIVDSFLKVTMISFSSSVIVPAGFLVGFCAARLFYEALDFFYDSFFKQKVENLKKYKKDVDCFVSSLKKELCDELMSISRSVDMNIDSAECCVFGKKITEKSLTEKIFNINVLKKIFSNNNSKEKNKYLKKMFKTYAGYINEYYFFEFKKRLKANDVIINQVCRYFDNKNKKVFDYNLDREIIDKIKSEEIERCNLECEKERSELEKNILKNTQLKDFLVSNYNSDVAKIIYNMLQCSPIKCIDIYWKGDSAEYMKDKENKKDINSFHFGQCYEKNSLIKKKESLGLFEKVKKFFSKTEKKNVSNINSKNVNVNIDHCEDGQNPSCNFCQSTALSINENKAQQSTFI